MEYLPPTWAPDEDSDDLVWDGPWGDFDKRLAAAIGVSVEWEDREWFRIDHPQADTTEAIHRFLLAEKRRVIAERQCMDPVYAEIMKLEGALRRWKECPARPTANAPPRSPSEGSEAGAPLPGEGEITRMKTRLGQLSPRRHFRIFSEEGWPKAEPGAAADARSAFSPSWRTETAVALASVFEASQDFSVMPILADALEEAGCGERDILDHCRGSDPHVRGCWVMDLVLGKQ
jgi:hypothetical protein